MRQNITLSIDKELIQKAKLLAVQRHSSISQMLSDELKRMVLDAEGYEMAKKRALNIMKNGFNLGGRITASREELHER